MLLGSTCKDTGKWDRRMEAPAGGVKKQVAAVGTSGLIWPWTSGQMRGMCRRACPPSRGKAGRVFVHQHPWVMGWGQLPGGSSALELLASLWSEGPACFHSWGKPTGEGLSCLYLKKLSVSPGKVGAKNIRAGFWQHLLRPSTMQNCRCWIDPKSCLLNTNRTLCYYEYIVSDLGRTHK